jgi:opacity protein-like surface antigen
MLFAVAAFAAAQENPKVEIFTGYSLFHFDDNGLENAINAGFPGCCNYTKIMHGWEAPAQFNLNKTFGIVADFSGHYGSPVQITGGNSVDGSIYNVLFGPQINLRGKRMSGYVHTLLGFQRAKIQAIPGPVNSPDFSNNAFEWAIGGGFDYNATKTIAIRLGQLDYLLGTQDFGLATSTAHQNNLRYSAGIVFRLGGQK